MLFPELALLSPALLIGHRISELSKPRIMGSMGFEVYRPLTLVWFLPVFLSCRHQAARCEGYSQKVSFESNPSCRIMVTDLGGEFRFASSAAKRLQSLGALLKGDRRALGAGADLKEFDVDNDFGLEAIRRVCTAVCGSEEPMLGVLVSPCKFFSVILKVLECKPSVFAGPGLLWFFLKPYARYTGILERLQSGSVLLGYRTQKGYAQHLSGFSFRVTIRLKTSLIFPCSCQKWMGVDLSTSGCKQCWSVWVS